MFYQPASSFTSSSRPSRRYVLNQVVHRGTHTVLYRGEMQAAGHFARAVVIKLIKPEFVGVRDVEARLRDEARLLGLIRHRAILGAHGVVTLAGRLGIVMEHVGGEDLLTLLRQGPVPLSCALEIVEEVAAALDVAWRAPGDDGEPLRLCHRALEPRSVRITPEGAVKLVGFDFARANLRARESTTRALSRCFPLASDPLDGGDGASVDLPALGALLYLLVHGDPLPSRLKGDRMAALGAALERISVQEPARSELLALLSGMLGLDAESRLSLREVQRRASDLRRRVGGATLSAWAAGASRRVPARVILGPADPLAGGAFVEGDSVAPPPVRSDVPWAVLGLVAAGAAMVAGALLLLLIPLLWTSAASPLRALFAL